MPPETIIYSGHEYSAANAKFALSIEPENAALRARADAIAKILAAGKSTVPTTLAEELADQSVSDAPVQPLVLQKSAGPRTTSDQAENSKGSDYNRVDEGCIACQERKAYAFAEPFDHHCQKEQHQRYTNHHRNIDRQHLV